MGQAFAILICYHLLLFRRFYFQNPYIYARSEALEQGFASSWLLGQQLRQKGFFSNHVEDQWYYPDYQALPFLSTYYPIHRAQAWIGSFLNLNQAWIVYSLTMVLHFLICGIACYILLVKAEMPPIVALFGTITLSSLGYAMKQNSCIVYTLAWVPGLILCMQQQMVVASGISLGMMLLAGYWPIALYTIPLGCYLWMSLSIK